MTSRAPNANTSTRSDHSERSGRSGCTDSGATASGRSGSTDTRAMLARLVSFMLKDPKLHKFTLPVVAAAGLFFYLTASAGGNQSIESFSKAKKLLAQQVYMDHRVTLYCQATYDEEGKVNLPKGFVTPKHEKRAAAIEWEHVVPAENFGRFFSEWREGSPACIETSGKNQGKAYKGRRCADKASQEYRLMQADLYNLYPAIGAVNALRLNYNYAMLPDVKPTFGSCTMKIANERAEPPEYARGTIARSTLYMADAYPRFRISDQQRQLMEAWNKTYPVDDWECTRAQRIAKLQGNPNRFVEDACRKAGFMK